MSEVMRLARAAKKAKAAQMAKEVPGKLEFYQGELREVVDAGRSGWWRFNRHYDRDGYCDNPARGY